MTRNVSRCMAAAAAVIVLFATNAGRAGEGAELIDPDPYGLTLSSEGPAIETARLPAALDLWREPATLPATGHCDGCGDAGCSDAGCSSCGNVCSSWCSPRWWGQADLLTWWTKGNSVPALVTTSPDGTQRGAAGVLGQPGTRVLFGQTGIDDNYRTGIRATVGYWLDDCRTAGVEVTWFSLGDGANSGNFYARSVGTPLSPILARPFYDVRLGQQNAQLVAFPDVIEGAVQVTTDSEMHSVAVLLRNNLSDECGNRVDVVGGYRYLRFRESLTIRENLVSTDPGGAVALGTTFDLFDSFGVENDFHGGEIGLSMLVDRGNWSLDILTKIALGNMHQRVLIDGQTAITVPTQPAVIGPGGLLALPSNIGSYEKNRFALIPELNLNLRYRLSDRLSATFGYSALWITDVARSGDQVDFGVNTSQLPANGGNLTGPARPAPMLNSTSMWAQGVNFGVAWQY